MGGGWGIGVNRRFQVSSAHTHSGGSLSERAHLAYHTHRAPQTRKHKYKRIWTTSSSLQPQTSQTGKTLLKITLLASRHRQPPQRTLSPPWTNLSSQECFPQSMEQRRVGSSSMTSQSELIHPWLRLVIINCTHCTTRHLVHVFEPIRSARMCNLMLGMFAQFATTIGWDMSWHFALIVSRQSVIYVSRHGATASMWECANVFVWILWRVFVWMRRYVFALA